MIRLPLACLLAPAFSLAAPLAARAEDPPVIVTRAIARDRLPNTIADISLGIEIQGKTVAEVQAALSKTSAPLMDFIRTAGADRVRTENLSVRPDLDPNPPRGQAARILSYTGTIAVTFQAPAENAGSIAGDALSHGANTIDSISPHPRQSEIDAVHGRLAAAATRIALEEARAVAEAANMKAGPPRLLDVSGQEPYRSRPIPLFVRSAAAPMPAAPPIATAAGDSEVTATVTATVTLLPP